MKINSKKKEKSTTKHNTGNNRGNRDENNDEDGEDEQEKQGKSLLPEGAEFYGRAFMDFDMFEVEFFVKPILKPLKLDVWTDMM